MAKNPRTAAVARLTNPSLRDDDDDVDRAHNTRNAPKMKKDMILHEREKLVLKALRVPVSTRNYSKRKSAKYQKQKPRKKATKSCIKNEKEKRKTAK